MLPRHRGYQAAKNPCGGAFPHRGRGDAVMLLPARRPLPNPLDSQSVPRHPACCQCVRSRRLRPAARSPPPNPRLPLSKVDRAGCLLPAGVGPGAVGAAVPIPRWPCPCLA